jgi:hypothetical protein
MAQKDLTDNEWKAPWQDAGGNPFGFLMVGEGTSSAFSVVVLNNGSTSYYLWVDTTGDLRIGTTEPTVATVNSAGAVVGDQS